MFAHRVQSTTTRTSISLSCHHYCRHQWRTISTSALCKSSRHRRQTALVDQSGSKGPTSVEEIKEQTKMADKHGKRGSQKMSIDEMSLPVMDVYLQSPRRFEKELFFPFYPSIGQLPRFRKRKATGIRTGLRLAKFRDGLREWRGDNPPTGRFGRNATALTFGIYYTVKNLIQGLTSLNPYRLYNAIVGSLGATGSFIAEKWGNHRRREYDWRLFLKWRRRVAQQIIDRLEQGPEARELYLKRIQNEDMNYAAMKLLAEKQKFPGYDFPGDGMVDRQTLKLRVKYAKEIEEEDKLLRDLSSKDSPLHPILEDAATRYVEMNQAVASGDTARLTQFADRRYLNELERRARNVGLTNRDSITSWKFHGFTQPPTCLSIRAHDFYSPFRKSLVVGDRLYANMLVKFESIQSLKVTKKRHPGLEGSRRDSNETVIEKQKVVEYLVLDVRTWVPGRHPKFVMEIYEGQPLEVKQQDYISSEGTQEKKADGKGANEDAGNELLTA